MQGDDIVRVDSAAFALPRAVNSLCEGGYQLVPLLSLKLGIECHHRGSQSDQGIGDGLMGQASWVILEKIRRDDDPADPRRRLLSLNDNGDPLR